MSLLERRDILEYKGPELTDLYHPCHPLHHLILAELEEECKAYEEYYKEINS